MKWTRLLSVLMLAISITFFATSCKKKPTDAEIKANVETAVANSSVMVDVQEGVVTLGGTVADDAAKSSAESSAKTVEGVKSVTNNLGVTPPPPPAPPVVIADDSALTTGVNEVVKNFKGVSASVNDGVVTLTGTIKKSELATLMQTIMALRPKSVENKLTVN
jgi:hyperosmotically inducible protein